MTKSRKSDESTERSDGKKRQFRTTTYLKKLNASQERRHKNLATKVRRLQRRIEALEETVDPLRLKEGEHK